MLPCERKETMEEKNLNATGEEISQEEVVQPQYNDGAFGNEENIAQEGFTNPQEELDNVKDKTNFDEMSDEDFEKYINSAQNGTLGREVQANEYDVDENADKNKNENTPISKTGNVEPEDGEEEKPFRIFATKEEFQGVIDGIMGERLKKNREDMSKLDGLKRQALNFYGTDDADTALKQLIEDIEQQNADKKGMSVEEYKQQSKDSIDAQKYREEQRKATDRDNQIAEIQQKWQSESEDLRAIVPEFDFAKAMQNKTFYDNIVRGKSVSTAYLAANTQNTVIGRVKTQRRAIIQNGNMKGNTAGKVEANPATMSDADFRKYIDRIQRR